MNDFFIKLIAMLDKLRSKTQLDKDIKDIQPIKLPLTGTLNKAKTKAQLNRDLQSITPTVTVNANVNSQGLKQSTKNAVNQTQKNTQTIAVDFSIRKEKLINDIKILGQENSKLFKNNDMSAKYHTLLSDANIANSEQDIRSLRTQLEAMRSELKANNLAGASLGETLRKTFKRAAELFTGTGAIMAVSQQLRNAWNEAMTLDKSYTNLVKVQDQLTRSDYPEYLEQCNKKAQDLATTQKSLIEGATEFSKSGYNLSDSNALSEKSAILENVGDMSATDSAKAIISGVQAYDEIGGYTDVIGKATALIDKYNEIGNTASITSAEIAKGVQAVGSVFADANTDVDEFISLLAAGNRQYQNADSLALGLRTSALRLRAATVDLENAGEDIDGVISILDNQEKIKALTGVDILGDDGNIRSIYDIFLDISKVYKGMSDVDQSALLKIIAGTHRSSAISAVLNNMSEATQIYENSINSAGSAQKEYDTYLQSSEASLNKFKSSITETYQSVINGNTTKGILDAGNAAVTFANSFGLVNSTLRGFVAIGVVKALATLSTAMQASVLSVNNFGQALKSVESMSKLAKNSTEYANALNHVKSIAGALTEVQLKQVLANKALNTSERMKILQATGLSKAQVRAKLSQLGLVQSTNAQNTANQAATVSTYSLSAAVKGFGQSVKLAFMSNPVGITIMALSTVIGVVTSKISEYNEKVKETRQANIDAATSASEKADELSNLYTQYDKLNNIQKRTTTQEDEFKTVVENITKALGDKADVLEGLTAGTDDYTDSLKKATQAELESQYTTAKIGAKAAEDELRSDAFSSWDGSKITIPQNERMTGVEEHVAALEKVKDILKEYEDLGRNGKTWEPVDWDKDSTNMKAVVEYYNALLDARNAIVTSDDADFLMKSDIYESINTTINSLSESVDAYTQKQYEALKLEYMWQNGIPVTNDELQKMQQYILDASGAGEQFQNVLKGYLVEDFPALNSSVESLGDAAENTADAMNSLDGTWDYAKTIEQLDAMKDKLNVLDQMYAKLFDSDEQIGFDDYNSILEAFKDIEGLDISSYIQQLTEAGQNTDQVKEITENLITEYLNLSGVLDNVTEDNQQLITSMLEEMGIENASQIVTDALVQNMNNLAAQKIIAANASFDLANATADEIQQLVNESGASETTKQQLALLALQKQMCNRETLNFTGDIENLQALARQAGASAAAIATIKSVNEKLTNSRLYTNNPEKAQALIDKTYNNIYDSIANKAQLKNVQQKSNLSSGLNGTSVKPKYTGGKNTSKAIEDAQKEAKKNEDTYDETIDFFEQRIKVLQQSLDILDKSMENVLGSKHKNQLLSAQSGIVSEEMNNYTDALAMYQKKADEALSQIDSSIRDQVVNGSVSITEFIGKGNEDTVKAIQNYQNWAEKVGDCKEQLAELAKKLREIELSKFNNIVDEYTDKTELFTKATDNINKQIDLFEEAGQIIGEGFYDAQKQNSQRQLNLLEEEKSRLVKQLNESLASGRLTSGTDEWLEMVGTLSELDGSIIDCKKSIEEMDNAILNLRTEELERVQTAFGNIRTELENIVDLLDDADVSLDDGTWTSEGVTKLGLLAQQYETARLQAQEYGKQINELNANYLAGKYSATEYAEKLADLTQNQYDAINAYRDAEDAIMDVNQSRVDIMTDAINKETEARRENINAKLAELDALQNLENYKRQIADKNKSITDIERSLAAISNDNSAAAKAQRAKLQDQLNEAKKDLSEYEFDHNIDSQKEALNKEMEDYEKSQQQRIDSLNAYLENREQVISDSFESVKANTSTVADELTQIAQEHGVKISDTITSAWNQGSNAIASYGQTLSAQSSVFLGNLLTVQSGIYALSAEANNTANSLGYMFSTSANTLLSELQSSYNSVGNVNTASQALKDSLVNTLERGYNINSITKGLNSIADSASSAANSVRDLNNALSGGSGSSGSSKKSSSATTTTKDPFESASSDRYNMVDTRYGRILEKGLTAETVERLKKGYYKTEWQKNYITFMKAAKGGIVTKEKDNPFNAIAQSVGEDTMIAAKEGESVLTKDQTKGIQSLAENISKPNRTDPITINGKTYYKVTDYDIPLKKLDEQISQMKADGIDTDAWLKSMTMNKHMFYMDTDLPTIEKTTIQQPVNIQVGNMVEVQGSLDSATMPQVKKAIDQGINNLGVKLTKQLRYGGT